MSKEGFRGRAWKALALVLAAAALAFGLEALLRVLLPPQYVDTAEGAATWVHPRTGRLALAIPFSPLRLAVNFVMQLGILLIVFPLGLGRRVVRALKAAGRAVAGIFRKENRRRSLIACAWMLGTGVGGFFLIRALAEAAAGRSTGVITLFSALAALGLALLPAFRGTLGRKPEIFFLIYVLLIGGVLAFGEPVGTTISWDDGHHYQQALNYSTLGQVRFTEADMITMEPDNKHYFRLGKKRDKYLQSLEEADDQGAAMVTDSFHLNPIFFWDGTYGLGLFLGRLLGLSYQLTWCLGRMTGVLCYAWVGYFAIRRLRYGKILLSLVLMLPQALFLSANFSYDPGVICLNALGLSYCFAVWQEPEKKATVTDQAVMIGAMTLGCLAKAVYAPVLLLPLLLPGSHFRDEKARRRFLLADLGALALLLLSFLLPMALGATQGDSRGGEGVSATGQAAYILSHPLGYAGILLSFLSTYLSPEKAGDFMTSFAYLGTAPGTGACLIALTAAALTDRGSDGPLPESRGSRRALALAMLAAALVLVVTSMYVAYTPVGTQGIAGCQPRYLLPLIFPALMLLGSGKIRNGMKPALYNGLLLGAMAYIGFAAVFATCVARYR